MGFTIFLDTIEAASTEKNTTAASMPSMGFITFTSSAMRELCTPDTLITEPSASLTA